MAGWPRKRGPWPFLPVPVLGEVEPQLRRDNGDNAYTVTHKVLAFLTRATPEMEGFVLIFKDYCSQDG